MLFPSYGYFENSICQDNVLLSKTPMSREQQKFLMTILWSQRTKG